MTATPAEASRSPLAIPTAATIGALGVVYGDIGTSPLYALKEAVRAAIGHGGSLTPDDLSDITYYVGRETIIPREDVPGMWLWRESLFAFLQRNAERSAAFFGVPTKQVVEFGTEIEI
jgi:K+ transporter